jgi:hypothetical protein
MTYDPFEDFKQLVVHVDLLPRAACVPRVCPLHGTHL